MQQILINIGIGILQALLTAKVIKGILVALIEWAVSSTETKVDDNIAKPILEALKEE